MFSEATRESYKLTMAPICWLLTVSDTVISLYVHTFIHSPITLGVRNCS